ncbi:hypothetical protein GALL_282210 [mine drainage metagenome]|uniref:Uncharacterized protein n=1 Tax=mine drainage metagenome TaxID=410659 RepID=A0A1J5R1S7_9ZZZZ
MPAPSAACCTAASTQPASATSTPSAVDMSRMRFMRLSDSSSWVPPASVVAPPTKPVLPPCGTMGTRCVAHNCTTSATCAVSPGMATAMGLP